VPQTEMRRPNNWCSVQAAPPCPGVDALCLPPRLGRAVAPLPPDDYPAAASALPRRPLFAPQVIQSMRRVRIGLPITRRLKKAFLPKLRLHVTTAEPLVPIFFAPSTITMLLIRYCALWLTAQWDLINTTPSGRD
jgi:hypothetical protein